MLVRGLARSLVALSIGAIVVACVTGSDGRIDGSGAAASDVSGEPGPSTGPSASDDGSASPGAGDGPTIDAGLGNVPAEVLDPLLADAAARAGADPSELRVVQARPAEWSDGSLGCPEPGMMYTQAIVSGWWVLLEHAGRAFDYRATGPGAFRICQDGDGPGGGYGP
jgi:hypothetical protein